MPTLHRDYETRSTLDLKRVGAARYAADPTTDVWCVGYAIDDGPVQLWRPGEAVPQPFIDAATNPAWTVVAHNDAFERAIEEYILAPRYGWPRVPIERHRCTMAQALACALPGKLEKAAEVLGLPLRKDAEGARVMLTMAKPRKPRRGEDDPSAGPCWHDAPEKIARLGEYCAQDVEVERALYHRLPRLSDAEQALWVLDAAINARGFYTDGPLLEGASCIAAAADQAVQDELAQITDGVLTSTDQTMALQAWLVEHGCEIPNIQKPILNQALRRKGLDPAVRRVIELRLGAAHASAAKVNSLLAWRNADGRVRGTLKYHGAATGRWSGHGPQPQNFKRDGGDIDAKRAAIATGDLKYVASLYPQPLEAVGDIARAVICVAPGHRFLIGDFSGIESRVLAWIAEEQTKLARWARFDASGDPKLEPYYLIGCALGLPEAIAREKGKVADLAFGYQGGAGAWDNLAPEDDPSSEEDKQRYKQTWRSLHQETERFWRTTDRAAIRAVRNPGSVHTVKRVGFACDAEFLKLTLPSGRVVRYPQPSLIERGFNGQTHDAVSFKDTALGKWSACNFGRGAYGGLWTENIVQAMSRDLLAEAMHRLDAAGYNIVLHVHDEIVAEVPIGFGSLDEFKRLLVAAPAWADGLPIAAKVREGLRFNKPAEPVAASDGHADNAADVAAPDVDAGDVKEVVGDATTPSPGDADTPAPDVIPIAAEGLAKPATEPPPFAFTFDDIRAAFERPRDEAPKGNGRDRRAGDGHNHAADRDGYPHGERDTGSTVAEYIYRHADGTPYLKIERTSTKQFPQYHLMGTTWVKGAPKGPRVPYRLPELVKAPLDAWVLICAGEKDADSAAALGFVATTNPEGERKAAWVAELNAWFAGRKRAVVMEDNDATGHAHALEVAKALRGIVPDIRIVQFCDLPEHGDLTDWLEQGHGKEDLQARIEAAKPFYNKPQPAPLRDWMGKPVPQPTYTVPGRVLAEQVFIFSGEGGEGKSSVLQQLCSAHCLGGVDWLGCTPCQGPAIYLECEDNLNALHWRQAAINEHYGTNYDVLADAGLQLISMIEHDTILAAPNRRNDIIETTAAYDWLYELAGDTKPVLIGIASTSNIFAGNENNRSEVQQFIKLLGRIALLTRGAIILVTHPSMSGVSSGVASHEGLSGTTQWHNAVRGRAVMKSLKPADDAGPVSENRVREIRFHKNQYGPPVAASFVRYQNGLFLPVDGMHSADAAERANKADQVFIELLLRWTEQDRKVSANPNPSNYAPTNFARQPEANGLTAKDLAAAMERLLRAKLIENRTFTKGRERRSYLAVARKE